MRTFVVTDDALIALSSWARSQLETAHSQYHVLGSLVAEERARLVKYPGAATLCIRCTYLLVPDV